MATRTILNRRTIDIDGVERTYYVHLPPAYDAGTVRLPLILAFHGGGGKATMMHRVSKLTASSDAHDFIVVYPDGLEKHWSDQRSMTGFDRVSDLKFIDDLLDELIRNYQIDENRIYSTGISNGGFFSQDLAIAYPQRFAAIASIAASVSVPVYTKVTPPQPVPIMFILGEDDPIVPYAGGDVTLGSERRGCVVSADQSRDYWMRANHCTKCEAPEQVGSAEIDDTSVIKQRCSGESARNEVLLYTVRNGGHTWPSGWQYLGESFIGKTSRAINANEEIWAFFQRHHL